jgi:hypothetical protein
MIDQTHLAWRGIESCYEILINRYSEIEIQSLTMNVSSVLSVGKAPPLGKIALHIVVFSLFLGLEIMTFKLMQSVIGGNEVRTKSFRRRTYLAFSYLKICGLVKLNFHAGEYVFLVPRKRFHEVAMNRRRSVEAAQKPLSIGFLLNRLSGCYLESVQKARALEIQNLLKGVSQF